MYTEITKCRICENDQFETIIDLGFQTLTGIFPKNADEKITTGPLTLVKCSNTNNPEACGLVQLKHTYENVEMFGQNYGYRSGLNSSMVRHLKDIVNRNLEFVQLRDNDLVIDIASNDGTLLSFYPKKEVTLVGVDPTSVKFAKYYESHIKTIGNFFDAELIEKEFKGKKARIITSIAMFYDLEQPLKFVQDIYKVLADDGIWVFEQSYMPLMIKQNAYDTICHEHIEYYGLKQVKWLLDKADFKIIDIEFNDINGGSFKLTVAKSGSAFSECFAVINEVLEKEKIYDTREPFVAFKNNIEAHKEELFSLLKKLKSENKTVFGYGASTKGNVILQYCGITEEMMPFIAEVNEDKFGSFTPGTLIPIISETEARAKKPYCFVVLPWHFRDNIIIREKDTINSGIKFIFPLPFINIIENV